MALTHLHLTRLDRTLTNGMIGQRKAMISYRTRLALWRGRRAAERTQFHHRLVMMTCMLIWQQLSGQSQEILLALRRVNRSVNVEETRQDAIDISIHHRHLLI